MNETAPEAPKRRRGKTSRQQAERGRRPIAEVIGGTKLNARKSVREYDMQSTPIGIEVPDEDFDLNDDEVQPERAPITSASAPARASTPPTSVATAEPAVESAVELHGAVLDPDAHAERLCEAIWPPENLPDTRAVGDALRVWVDVTAITIRTIEAAKEAAN